MAEKINVVGTQPETLEMAGEPRRRIEPSQLAAALGAEPCGDRVSGGFDLIDLAEFGSELLRRLRSEEGSLACEAPAQHCSVSLRTDDVKVLEKISAQIEESTGTKPSLDQLTSAIVRTYVNKVADSD